MIAYHYNSLCKQAEIYYYDALYKESDQVVPEFIINHFKQCQHCQDQLNQLKHMLSQTEQNIESQQRQVSSVTGAILKLHFAYIDKPVTCKAVKPFLHLAATWIVLFP